jgi:hypothetical protein
MRFKAATVAAVVAVAAALCCLPLAACQRTANASTDDHGTIASYTELAVTNKPMRGGTNIRMMNRMTPGSQRFVSYDSASGLFTFAPGTYRIDAYSLTVYGYFLTKPQQDSVHSAPGYAFLCDSTSNQLVLLGSMQDPMYALPSLVDGVITVTRPSKFYLAHQNGDDKLVAGVKLQTADTTVTTSINHAFASITIQKLPDAPATKPMSYGPCGAPKS